MKLLLDTHAFLWSVLGSKELSKKARAAIADFSNDVYVSAATAWEITTKYRIGKLPQASQLVHSFRDIVHKMTFTELPVLMEHAVRAGLWAGNHKDPFDRMLVAQAISEDFTLVSNEKLFDTFHIRRLW